MHIFMSRFEEWDPNACFALLLRMQSKLLFAHRTEFNFNLKIFGARPKLKFSDSLTILTLKVWSLFQLQCAFEAFATDFQFKTSGCLSQGWKQDFWDSPSLEVFKAIWMWQKSEGTYSPIDCKYNLSNLQNRKNYYVVRNAG